jgi:hypothetical protein
VRRSRPRKGIKYAAVTPCNEWGLYSPTAQAGFPVYLFTEGLTMVVEGLHYSVCSSRPPRKTDCDSREIAMGHLEANIKKARDNGGSAGMLDNGRWELHFPNTAMILYWVEDSDGDVQKLP